MRPYNRSLHPDDYSFLEPWNADLRYFQREMVSRGVPHREWCEHRFWEYASILQQLNQLDVPFDAEVIDLGAGASFFDPYLALFYPSLCVTDNMKYGDITNMVELQRVAYGVQLPLYNFNMESMPLDWSNRFDVTLCISSIEHVDYHDAAFGEMVRITKPGGLIMMTSDYFRDHDHFEKSISRHLQVTPYTQDFILDLGLRFPIDFVGSLDLEYQGDFVHNYSFCNLCLRKRA